MNNIFEYTKHKLLYKEMMNRVDDILAMEGHADIIHSELPPPNAKGV